MKIVFADEGWEDYLSWQSTDRATLKRLNRLIEACRRSPYDGIGKPEALRENLSGLLVAPHQRGRPARVPGG